MNKSETTGGRTITILLAMLICQHNVKAQISFVVDCNVLIKSVQGYFTNSAQAIVSPKGWTIVQSRQLPRIAGHPRTIEDFKNVQYDGTNLVTFTVGCQNGETRSLTTSVPLVANQNSESTNIATEALVVSKGDFPPPNTGLEFVWYAYASKICSHIDWNSNTQWPDIAEIIHGKATAKMHKENALCPSILTFIPEQQDLGFSSEEVTCDSWTNWNGIEVPLVLTINRSLNQRNEENILRRIKIELKELKQIEPPSSFWPDTAGKSTVIQDFRRNKLDSNSQPIVYVKSDGVVPSVNDPNLIRLDRLQKIKDAAPYDNRPSIWWLKIAAWSGIVVMVAVIYIKQKSKS